MKFLFNISCIFSLAVLLGGCLASTTSPTGVSCDYMPGKAIWEMPLICQGR